MRVLPVVERELRAIARRPSAYWVRSVSAAAAFVALGYVALIGAVGFSTANQGRDLFGILSWGAFAYCLLAGIRGTSDALSFEKREGTLGLLFLTDLKGYDVVMGKLVSVSINSIYGILAVAPPLALAFLLGGTSAAQFVLMIVFLLNTLFFSLSVGMLVSTFSQNDRSAMGGTLAIIFVMLVMPYGIAAAHSYGVLDLWEVTEPGFLLPSPGFAFWSIKDATLMRIYTDEIRLSIAFINLAGWLCLIIASGSIATRAYADAPRGKLVTWFTRVRQQWAYGKAERRRAIRGAFLDRNAFAWLAGRDRLKQRYAWTFLILLAALWLFSRWKAPEVTEEWPITLFALWFVHLFFKVWIASEVAARFIEDRRSNALELLLTTPLKLGDFVRGQRLALLRQFGAPLAAIVLLDLFAGMKATDSSSYLIRSPEPIQFFSAGLVHLVFDLYAIQWVAIWRSLHLRGTNRTISQTIGMIVFLPVFGWFFIWQGSWIAWALTRRGAPSAAEILWTWTILCAVYDVILALVARHSFYAGFREAATKPFDKPTPFSWRFRRRNQPRDVAHVAAVSIGKRLRPRFSLARKIAASAIVCLFGGFVAVTIRKHRLDAAISARIAAVRSSGLPLTPTEFAMWHTGPSADESASTLLRRASKLFSQTTIPIHLVDQQAHWNSLEKMAPDLKKKIQAWMADNRPIYGLLEQLPNRKPGGPPPDGNKFQGIRSDEITHALQIKARVELEDDPVAAAKTISVLLYHARALESEPFYAFLGANNALKYASQLLERAALQGGFPAETWREWRTILAQSDPVSTLRANFIFERAQGLETLSQPAPMLYLQFGTPMADPQWLFNASWSIRCLFGQDRVEVIEFLDELNNDIAKADRPFWEVRTGPWRDSWKPRTIASSTIIAPQLEPAFEWIFTMTTEMVARHRILRTVCDIEMWRAEHGSLPTFPGDIPAVDRIDPFTGNNLRFIARGAEYTVYSVGQDGADDGGVGIGTHRTGDLPFSCGKPPERKRGIKNP